MDMAAPKKAESASVPHERCPAHAHARSMQNDNDCLRSCICLASAIRSNATAPTLVRPASPCRESAANRP
ncbi:hypothetical protein BURPS305_6682 [Burkholderia pseudomallei 305]|nr:hypothetical protein BURPS305_6682 [Burkholderia pseudomallei 305]